MCAGAWEHEVVLRQMLNWPRQPAVILALFHSNFWVERNTWGYEALLRSLFYNIPVVASMYALLADQTVYHERDASIGMYEAIDRPQGFKTPYHFNPKGLPAMHSCHDARARSRLDCLLALSKARKSWASLSRTCLKWRSTKCCRDPTRTPWRCSSVRAALLSCSWKCLLSRALVLRRRCAAADNLVQLDRVARQAGRHAPRKDAHRSGTNVMR